MRIYAIGDIHGQFEMLLAAHDRIAKDRKVTGDANAPIVHLGDFGDRGPATWTVIDYFLDGIRRKEPWLFIKGNHDRMFTGFLSDANDQDPRLPSELYWLHPRLGGDKTLESYGVKDPEHRPRIDVNREARAAVPVEHVEFLTNLPLTFETPDLFFTHAGIRPGIDFSDQNEDDLLWIRQGFLDDDRDHGKLIVHGHTALDAPEHLGNRVNLDSGAGYFRSLTAAVFEGRDCWTLTKQGRVPLTPSNS